MSRYSAPTDPQVGRLMNLVCCSVLFGVMGVCAAIVAITILVSR